MKNKIKYLLMFLLLICVFVCSGCSNACIKPNYSTSANENIEYIHNEYFDCEVIENINETAYIIRDKNTNVLYLVVGGFRSSIITPIYNSDGTVKLYEPKE